MIFNALVSPCLNQLGRRKMDSKYVVGQFVEAAGEELKVAGFTAGENDVVYTLEAADGSIREDVSQADITGTNKFASTSWTGNLERPAKVEQPVNKASKFTVGQTVDLGGELAKVTGFEATPDDVTYDLEASGGRVAKDVPQDWLDGTNTFDSSAWTGERKMPLSRRLVY